MHVKVEDVLSCGFTVLLDDADAVGGSGFFNGERNEFGDLVDLAEFVFWDVKDVDVVGFGDDKGVSHV